MYLLEAIDNYKKHKKEKYFESEYELLCRVHLTGVLDVGCVSLQFWELPLHFESDKVRAAYLKILSLKDDTENIIKEAPPKDEQYYIPGGLPNEITILMTLFTRAHFVLSRTLRQAGTLLMNKYASEEDVARGDIDGKTLRLEDIKPYFDMLEGFRLIEKPEKSKKVRRLEPFMLAARFYHLAFSLTYKDETLAYISLICAMEALLHDYDIQNFSLEDWNEKAAKLIKSALSDHKKYQEIEQAIITKPLSIKQRFKAFIIEHITDKFWSDSTRPDEKNKLARFKDLADIEEYSDRIYVARSRALHDGIPFPPSGWRINTERPPGLGMRIGTKEWKEKELIPPVGAFERIVHHVLLEYLRRESERGFNSLKNTNGKERK